MSSILMMSNADSIWIFEYIKNVLYDYDVVLLSPSNVRYKKDYEEKGIVVYSYGNRECNKYIKFFKEACTIFRIIKENRDVDFIQYSCIDKFTLIKSIYMFFLKPKKIITFWGSDILRASRVDFYIYQFFLNRCFKVNLLTNNMRKKFEQIYGSRYNRKLTCFDFGCNLYSEIDEIESMYTIDECKKRYGFDIDKVTVAIGYNNSREQQHEAIIKCLNNLSPQNKDRFQFVLHMGYGNSDRIYCNKIESLLNDVGLNYVLIYDYLDKIEVAMLRRAVDIFIYAQTTDAISSSFLEYLYAGTLVFKPNWLDFYELDEIGIKYYCYEKIEEVQEVLNDRELYDDFIKMDLSDNKRKLFEYNSWSESGKKWRKMYLE